MENKPKKCNIKKIIAILSKKDIDKALDAVKADNSFDYRTFFAKSGMSRKSAAEFRKACEILDTENIGLIEEDELKLFLKNFSPNARTLTPEEVAGMMKDGDPNNEGKITLEGFMAMVELSKQ